ncbi:FHA domain-containing protein [Arenibacterium sp. LLYu02]|uniref:FHA domain-containing protein n=1 Tax=Arenibacterium sp. LLYu02 TaxID=3404132 RepID=UPI003B21B533
MKFIKDIIGEQRNRQRPTAPTASAPLQLDPAARIETPVVEAPARTASDDRLEAVSALLAAHPAPEEELDQWDAPLDEEEEEEPLAQSPAPRWQVDEAEADRMFAALEEAQTSLPHAEDDEDDEADHARDYRLFTRRRGDDEAPAPEARPARVATGSAIPRRITPGLPEAERPQRRAAVQIDDDLPPPLTDREAYGLTAQTLADTPVDVPAPALGRAAGRGGGRVKTRLLGFNPAAATDPFARERDRAAPPAYAEFPVGWLAVTRGPGRGATFTLHAGVSTIGRGADQAVQLDFGDTAISREQHAAIAYDPEDHSFYVGHGGKANLVRLNNRPVLATEVLKSGDSLRIGETELRFIALCDQSFAWDADQGGDLRHAAAR